MFTGIITNTGTIEAITPTDDGAQLTIHTENYAGRLITGSSHAINGVCLTLLEASLPLRFDLSRETIQKTTFDSCQVGTTVNIEPGLRMGDALDGHLVSGHIDGVATVATITEGNNSRELGIQFPPQLARFIAIKGSICMDGVSLTVNQTSHTTFNVTVIPHTITQTIISDYTVGTKVNLEIDMIARYVDKLVSTTHTS